ncbi:hypothetical protein LTR35_017660 [Friedmanniomyces endolithicus]|uniref:Xylanolytic transcriptional activator regulatory domain-containing protein n=1 Tax=Friedmanniomyces endolithicus TaxID=329885 RepID=A0AAN6F6B3_9PEZI|nr:hypothetical protein LTR35_017660 [Friedmanniomyces endolithicus]KAK0268696.1 hypothetical protein LTS00_017488 [Friedmanniomyces endolithicus]KAK0302859.1 hypothetical protein LTR82_017737 [Friedmanniomyces endolithicus]KAK0971795.1 hypothetical protein LTR54_017705 [Friedmanniomyces endolithicus]
MFALTRVTSPSAAARAKIHAHDGRVPGENCTFAPGAISVPSATAQAQGQDQHATLIDVYSSAASDAQSSSHANTMHPGNGVLDLRPTRVQNSSPDSVATNVWGEREEQSPEQNGTDPVTQRSNLTIGNQPAAVGPDFAPSDEFPPWLMDCAVDWNIFSSPYATDLMPFAHGWSNSPSENIATVNAPSPDLERIWFTHMDEQTDSQCLSQGMTPDRNQRRADIDENFRRTLHTRLQRIAMEPDLPSPDFLNLSIRSYFACFHPVFPVIHAPTFRPSKTNALLLLSICSIGSLFTGSSKGALQGARIFEWLNKAILATWERLMARSTDEVIPMVQAALIGQTFGLLSGDPKHLATVEAFHGCVISWARRWNMFRIRHKFQAEMDFPAIELDAKWREWAKREELIRIVLGLHIHDAELADMFHHEPFLRQSRQQLPQSADDDAFMASKPEEWLISLKRSGRSAIAPQSMTTPGTHAVNITHVSTKRLSSFTAYARLECLSATITETRLAGSLDLQTQQSLVEDLLSLHQQIPSPSSAQNPDPLGINILWHLTFVSLLTDFDLLEQAVGRDGPQIAAQVRVKVTSWAASLEAKRSIFHVQLIRKKIEALPLGLEPAVHIPRAIFLIAICWHCAYRYNNDNDTISLTSLTFPEAAVLGVDPSTLLFEANGYKHGRPTPVEVNEVICRFADLLQRLGHWEIARKFASIIDALVSPLI